MEKKETYKCLGIGEADTIKHAEMKEKNKKEYLKRTRKLLETKLHSWNLIKRINTRVVLLVKYSGPFLKWTREELKQMDLTKSMTMHKASHPIADADRLYALRKEGGRGLEDYVKWRKGKLITATRNNVDNTSINWKKKNNKKRINKNGK